MFLLADRGEEGEEAPNGKTTGEDAIDDIEDDFPNRKLIAKDRRAHRVGIDDRVEVVMGSPTEAIDVARVIRIGGFAPGPWLIGGEVEVATGIDHLGVIHIGVGVVIADNGTDEAPFLA